MTTTTTERVGRYQLLEPIGIGPGGSVSRANVFGVAGFERQFAVKRFHAELTVVGSLAQALSAAARAYGGLEHPRIARMSEFGVAQGITFTAVEYVAGLDSLRLIAEARLANTTLAAGGVLALVSQAARAVGYAHGRGLTHLGLSPTNVIVTSEGDVKITDFGILAAMLPARPVDVARLAHRIQYLAPEQLANEATSAATDVFALGVLAHELVTGNRTFKGDSPQQVAQSVMAGPPDEPPLPRPIVRVLQRCLARSPFERFPDARAFADALDAALRIAPVPGTRKDVGSQVKQTLERIAELHSDETSGIVALNLGAIPKRPVLPVAPLPRADRDSQDGVATEQFVRPEQTEPDAIFERLKPPLATVVGIAPPPIPTSRSIEADRPASKPLVGAVPPPKPMRSPLLVAPPMTGARRGGDALESIAATKPRDAEQLVTASDGDTTEPIELPIDSDAAAGVAPAVSPWTASSEPPQAIADAFSEPDDPEPARELPAAVIAVASSMPRERSVSRSRLRWVVVAIAGAAAFGATLLALRLLDDRDANPKGTVISYGDSSSGADAAVVAEPVAVRSIDATARSGPASIEVDASPPADAGADAGGDAPAGDSLAITSTPAGAHVFIDGADAGTTPLKRTSAGDRHTLAIVLPGHELYVAQVDGRGTFAIPLTKVVPSTGPAGIKVLKCKDKDRYYVFVDNKPTGQTCPTERIETALGPHLVEVYDMVSATRRTWAIDIKDTRLSYRVRIDP